MVETAIHPMIKIILDCSGWSTGLVRLLFQDVEPKPKYVSFHHDGGSRHAWTTKTWDQFIAQTSSTWVTFMTLHAFGQEATETEVWGEDPDLFTDSAYRQNPSALWEFYIWDNSEALLIFDPPLTLNVPEPWAIKRFMA